MRVCVCVCLTSLDTQCTILNNRGPDFWEFLQWLGSNYHLPGIQGVCVCACVCVCVCVTQRISMCCDAFIRVTWLTSCAFSTQETTCTCAFTSRVECDIHVWFYVVEYIGDSDTLHAHATRKRYQSHQRTQRARPIPPQNVTRRTCISLWLCRRAL